MDKNVEELRNLDLELESLAARKSAIKKALAEHRDSITDSQITEQQSDVDAIKKRESEIEARKTELKNIIEEKRSNFKMAENVEKRATMEYRKAWMEYIQRGVKSDILEFRADANTTTTTAATVIPKTVMEEIVRESKVSGNILSKVRKMNVKGGVQIPTLSAIPTASWITEAAASDRKALTTSSVTFSYYGLEVKIAQTLLSEYESVDAFEREFAVLAVEAMTNAKEIAIFNGSGTGQPTGILKATGVTESSIKLAELPKYDKLVAALGKLPAAYRAGAEIAMAAGTWDSIVGAVDTAGQPIARVNYGLGTGATYSLLGYPVNLVETDRLKDAASATAGTDYIMVIGQFNKYAINTSGNLGVYKYRDEDKNVDVTKALEFLDGNVLDSKAFVRVKLATAAAG